MIYLTTGANGAGKTLLTLHDVRKAQLAAPDRPVYYHGFVPKKPIQDFGWLPFEPAKWQDLPDGSICVFDEAQNEFPATLRGELPEWINAIAQHRRRRGFDFWILTPHPTMIHTSVRKLVESPSWHRHVKRVFGTDNASVATYNYAETRCELPSAGARGQVEIRSYPKDVYDWYESAVKHTGKRRIPKQVFVILAALVLVPLLGWFAWGQISAKASAAKQEAAPTAQVSNMPQGGGSSSGEPMTAQEYAASFSPRFPGFPHTASRYDEVTRPTVAPYPAACVASSKACHCYTQQATKLRVPDETCRQIVAEGFFVDWDQGGKGTEEKRPSGPPDGSASAPLLTRSPTDPQQAPRPSDPGAARDGAALAAMRNPA